ncbi:ADAM 17-like protease [Physella acuta]|uniref:ADAM 17-like protease n=1 Tax=Physella acuta TaxID=109671 RepID=UPI0027DE2A0B|nr:ADAM 17-like protease [Physella acuta]
MRIFIFIYVILIKSVLSIANLKYYETFSSIGVTSIVKRSNGEQKVIKQVRFKVFDRDFHLHLTTGTTVLAGNFKAYMVYEKERTSQFFIDQSKIFSGYLMGNEDVSVSAFVEDDLWTIHIYDINDTYAVEPAHRLIKDWQNLNHSQIAYRSSDLRKGASQCGVSSPMSPISQQSQNLNKQMDNKFSEKTAKNSHSRRARDSPDQNTCIVSLFGDYFLYKRHCNSNPWSCSAFMISVSHYADRIFRSTTFEGEANTYSNIGIQVGKITLFTSLSKTEQGQAHFNSEDLHWEASTKLQAFGQYASLLKEDFCLYILITSYPFTDGILGLGYQGGACTKNLEKGRFICVSLVTVESGEGNTVTNLQTSLVFTHGHNFASDHDPDTDECSFEESDGGNFIMWHQSVSGHERNNKLFSPCSKKTIGRKLDKAKCLVEKSSITKLCGNGLVEEGEECDGGALGTVGSDQCCNSDCTFKVWASCSSINTQCCQNCTIAPVGTLCMDENVLDCKAPSYCTGDSFKCPDQPNAKDWTECLPGAKCYKGECKDVCELESITENFTLQACLCRSSGISACQFCCFNVSEENSVCKPIKDDIVRDGTACYVGHCTAGVCTSKITSTVNRLFSYINSIEKSGIRSFMLSNMVLVIIIFASVFWIPAMLFCNHFDRIESEEKEIQETIYDRRMSLYRNSAMFEELLQRYSIASQYRFPSFHRRFSQRSSRRSSTMSSASQYKPVYSLFEVPDENVQRASTKSLENEQRASIKSLENQRRASIKLFENQRRASIKSLENQQRASTVSDISTLSRGSISFWDKKNMAAEGYGNRVSVVGLINKKQPAVTNSGTKISRTDSGFSYLFS